MPLFMKNRWAILTCCSETPKNWATEKRNSLQGFAMERVNLALCSKLKKLWSGNDETREKITSFQRAQNQKVHKCTQIMGIFKANFLWYWHLLLLPLCTWENKGNQNTILLCYINASLWGQWTSIMILEVLLMWKNI